MRVKVRLDTMSDIYGFVGIAGSVQERVVLEDNEGNRVSAKSLLGAIYSLEWVDIYCSCEKDISGKISKWII